MIITFTAFTQNIQPDSADRNGSFIPNAGLNEPGDFPSGWKPTFIPTIIAVSVEGPGTWVHDLMVDFLLYFTIYINVAK